MDWKDFFKLCILFKPKFCILVHKLYKISTKMVCFCNFWKDTVSVTAFVPVFKKCNSRFGALETYRCDVIYLFTYVFIRVCVYVRVYIHSTYLCVHTVFSWFSTFYYFCNKLQNYSFRKMLNKSILFGSDFWTTLYIFRISIRNKFISTCSIIPV